MAGRNYSREHGKSGYQYRKGCRCEPCVTFMRNYWKTTKERLEKGPIPGDVHGTTNGYVNYRCRCELCLEAWRAMYPTFKERRDANREELNRKRMEYYYNTQKPRAEAKEAARKDARRKK